MYLKIDDDNDDGGGGGDFEEEGEHDDTPLPGKVYINTSSGMIEAITMEHNNIPGRGRGSRGRGSRGRGRGRHSQSVDKENTDVMKLGDDDVNVSSTEAAAIKDLLQKMRSGNTR